MHTTTGPLPAELQLAGLSMTLPTPRFTHVATVAGNRLYVYGCLCPPCLAPRRASAHLQCELFV